MVKSIDLRSDTITKPTAGMREAIYKAEVGDDVFSEDPTVSALENKAAELLGREAALFVPSGTMANQIAIKTLTGAGDEFIMDQGAHPFMYESGAVSLISAVQLRPLPGKRGILGPEQIEAVIRADDVHFPPTRGVSIENTHNRGGGTIYPLETVKAIREVADRRGLVMHMDGARLFNACVAAGIPAREYARYCDTVSFCLSKGLGAPVGSLLVSDRDLIKNARRWRKALGGGMRQAGILAAAGIYALDHNIDRLARDHENAKNLARGLNGIDGLEIDPDEVQTNLVIFRITRTGLTAADLVGRLKENGVLVLAVGPDQIRAVTHLDVMPEEITRAVEIAAEVMSR